MSVLRLLVFGLIELLLYPITLLGLIGYMCVIFFVNRPAGVSGTAYEPLMNRLMMHEAGTREDVAASRLAAKLPATSPLLWLLLMGPTNLAMRVSGFRPKLVVFPPVRPASLMSIMTVRTQFFDQTLADALPDVAQLVILGAGWDTRAYDLPAWWSGRVFEVDAPATQRVKVRAIADAGIDASRVTFVAVNFNESSWLDELSAHGFDAQLPTYLLWEGVTMYLDPAAVTATFASVRQLGEGSRIAFDYFSGELVEGRPPYRLLGRLMPMGVRLTYGEQFCFGIPMQPAAREALRTYLSEQQLELLEFDTVGDGSLYGFCLARTAGQE